MTKLFMCMLLLCILATGFPAVAQQQQLTAEQAFTQLDTDKDGKLSEVEFAGLLAANASADQKKQTFAKWDANGDGFISKEEFTANYPANRGQQQKQQQ